MVNAFGQIGQEKGLIPGEGNKMDFLEAVLIIKGLL